MRQDFPAPCALCVSSCQTSETFKSVHQFQVSSQTLSSVAQLFSRQRVPGRMAGGSDKKSVASRVDAIEQQLHNVQALVNATAKGVGKDKVLLMGNFGHGWRRPGPVGRKGQAGLAVRVGLSALGRLGSRAARQARPHEGSGGLRAEDVVESVHLREPPENVSKV